MTEQEDKLFLRRLEEAIKRTDTRGEISTSDFWDTHRQSIAQERLKKPISCSDAPMIWLERS